MSHSRISCAGVAFSAVLSFVLGPTMSDPAIGQPSQGTVLWLAPLHAPTAWAGPAATAGPKIPRCPVGYHRVGHVCRLVLPRHEKRRLGKEPFGGY